jgi:hypothetical protein
VTFDPKQPVFTKTGVPGQVVHTFPSGNILVVIETEFGEGVEEVDIYGPDGRFYPELEDKRCSLDLTNEPKPVFPDGPIT